MGSGGASASGWAVGVGVAVGLGVAVGVGESMPVAFQRKPVVSAAPWKALSALPLGRRVATNR